MLEQSRTLARAAVLFLAPVAFLAGIIAHPSVRTYMETHVVADAVSGAPTQWLAAHLTMAVGIGLVLVAVLVIGGQLREAGERRWSAIGTPLLLADGPSLLHQFGGAGARSGRLTRRGPK